MSLRMFDFACPNGHVIELLVPADTREATCLECGQVSRRLIGAPRAVLEPFSGSFPGAADAWERRRESHMKKEQHNLREHGTYK